MRHLGYKHRPGGFGDSRHNVTCRAGQEAAVSDTERDQAGDRVQFGRGNLRRTRVVRENQRACVYLSLEPRGPRATLQLHFKGGSGPVTLKTEGTPVCCPAGHRQAPLPWTRPPGCTGKVDPCPVLSLSPKAL